MNNTRLGKILKQSTLVLVGTSICFASGCSVWENRPRLRKQVISLDEPVDRVPPITIDTINDHYLLTMQAPHAGWSFEFDKDDRTPTGYRVFITIREPDPSFLYPQMIVEKTLLTQTSTESTIEIYARVLGAFEKAEMQGYGYITADNHTDSHANMPTDADE